ncbi:MAG: immunity protein TriTu family protein [Actinopolymorphaceae bacterium]
MLKQAAPVEAIKTWLVERPTTLSEYGFTAELSESPKDHDPESVRLLLESDASLVELIAWTNGTVDLKSADVDSGALETVHAESVSLASCPVCSTGSSECLSAEVTSYLGADNAIPQDRGDSRRG